MRTRLIDVDRTTVIFYRHIAYIKILSYHHYNTYVTTPPVRGIRQRYETTSTAAIMRVNTVPIQHIIQIHNKRYYNIK